MNSTVTNVERTIKETLPVGKYKGTWCAYKVTVKRGRVEWTVTTQEGIRGISPCVVSVTKNGVEVSTDMSLLRTK